MPKETFLNGTLSIDYDTNDPVDQRKLTKKNSKGKSILTMTPLEIRDLLKALNDEYNLGLLP